MEREEPSGQAYHKRSFTLHGHRTSVALERAFWDALEVAAASQGIPLIHLIKKIDESRTGSLSSALRLYALEFAMERSVLK